MTHQTMPSEAMPHSDVRHTTRSAVLISAVDPFPTDSGKAIVLAGFLRHLTAAVGAQNVHYLHVGEPIADTSGFGDVQVIELGAPSRREQMRAMVADAGLRGRSLQEVFTSSATVAARLRAELDRLRPDLELVDTVRMAQLLTAPPHGRRVVYFDDLFSVRYERMLSVLASDADTSGFDPLGQFGQFIPERLQFLTGLSLPQRLLLTSEARRIRRAEVRVARDPDVALGLLLNDEESQLLRRLSGAEVTTIPVSVPVPVERTHEWNRRPDFVFMGMLSIAHNHDGLMAFLREGMPRLLELVPDAVLHVVGRNPDDALLAETQVFGDHVQVHGFVEDLDEMLMSKCALVNPLRFGSGVKIKTLDALGRGLPVVATAFGAEGVTRTSVPGLRIVEDQREAAEALAELADPGRRDEAAQGALDLFARRFSPQAVKSAYDQVFQTS